MIKCCECAAEFPTTIVGHVRAIEHSEGQHVSPRAMEQRVHLLRSLKRAAVILECVRAIELEPLEAVAKAKTADLGLERISPGSSGPGRGDV
jgi:hypothetical protein